MRWLVLLACVLLLFMQIIQAKYIMEFVYFGNCKPSHNSLPYRLENTSFGMVSSDQSELNTTLVIEQDFDVIKSKLKIYECKTKNDAECELVINMSSNDHCNKLREKGQFYSIFADTAHPPITCPLKKGMHHIVKASLPTKIISKLPIVDNCVYRLDFWHEYQGKLVGCWRSGMKKSRIRTKKN